MASTVAAKACRRVDEQRGKDKSMAGKLAHLVLATYSQPADAVSRNLAERRLIRCLTAAVRTNATSLRDLGIDSVDPFTNQPFLFRKTGGVTRIYSVGPNLTDDHGIAARSKDVVVMYPWSPEPATK